MSEQEKLWDEQNSLIEGINFILKAYQEETPINKLVTNDYPTIEGFIGQSVLETCDGNTGFFMGGPNGENIYVQFFSEGKKIHTYMKDGKILKYDFLITDNELDSPMKKLKHLKNKIIELQKIQYDLDVLDKEKNYE